MVKNFKVGDKVVITTGSYKDKVGTIMEIGSIGDTDDECNGRILLGDVVSVYVRYTGLISYTQWKRDKILGELLDGI